MAEDIAARPPGRPRIEINIERVRELAGLGLSIPQIASRLAVGTRTLSDRFTQDPAVRDAYEAGLASATEEMARALNTLAHNGNVTAMIFWLRCRAGWRQDGPAAPAVVVNLGAQQGSVTIEAVEALEASQRLLPNN